MSTFSIFCLVFTVMLMIDLVIIMRGWIAHKPFLKRCPNWVIAIIWCCGLIMVFALMFAAFFASDSVFI